MEKLTFDNFQERTTKTIIAKAKKMQARDVEEVSPNKFLAYIDDENESYDVAIEFNKKEILDISCDCPKHLTFCVHKVAFINYFKNNKIAATKKVVAKKKKSEAELLLEAIDLDNLRLWVSEMFKKNKDIEFLFVNEFSKSEISFTKEEIKIIIDKAIKSVIKNKKKIDATELKKIIDALEVALAPVMKFVKENIALPESNDFLLVIYSELIDFNTNMYLNSIKMIRFVEKIYKEINLYIHSLQNQQLWETVTKETINYFFDNRPIYTIQFDRLLHLYESIDTKERKAFFASELFTVFTVAINKGIQYNNEVKVFFIKVFSENELFSKVYTHFRPYRFDNVLNVFLIEKLIEIEKFDLAEIYSKEQIESNSNEKYNIDYYNLLHKIYSFTKDESKMALVQMKLIFHNFSLETYRLIKKYIPDDEFKKLRTRLLTHYKRSFDDNQNMVRAYFEIIHFEKNYKMMIENISYCTPYELIYNYKEELFQFDKVGFLDAITLIENHYYYYKKNNPLPEYRDKFIIWINQSYDKNVIQKVINNRKRYGMTSLIKELEKNEY